MKAVLFLAVFSACCTYCWRVGDREIRTATGTVILAVVATIGVALAGRTAWRGIEWPLLLIDVAVLAAFLRIAFRTRAWWPLFLSGFQLTQTLGHGVEAIEGLPAFAYWLGSSVWSYPMVAILVIATLSRQRDRTSMTFWQRYWHRRRGRAQVR